MELRAQKIREEFVDHIMALQDPAHLVIPRNFVVRFLNVVIPSKENLQRVPNPRFPVEVNAAAQAVQVSVFNLRRIILRSPNDIDKTPLRSKEFIQGIDFVLLERKRMSSGGVVRPLFLTVSCFQRACMQMRGQTGIHARHYFDLVARSYYDYMGEDIWERLKVEDPLVTLEKKQHPKYYKNSAHLVSYDFLVEADGKNYVYTGITDDQNIRMQKHIRTKPWLPKEFHSREDVDPLFDEVCCTLLYAPYRAATPSLIVPGATPTQLETSPFFDAKQKPRKKAYSWLDGNVWDMNTHEYLQKLPTLFDNLPVQEKIETDTSKEGKTKNTYCSKSSFQN